MHPLLSWPFVWKLARPLFNFTASKFVVIKDWRLGVALRAMQVCVFCYLTFQIIWKASYLETETPTGIFVTQAGIEDDSVSYEMQTKALENDTLPYCKNPDDYAFQWSKKEYKNFKCTMTEPSNLPMKAENEFFMTTSFMRENVAWTTKTADGKCPENVASLTEDFEVAFEGRKSCLFTKREHFFPVMPETINVNVLHGYSTSTGMGKNGHLTWTVVKSSNPSIEDVIFEEGQPISLPLSQWLALANVDLDGKADSSEGAQLQGDSGSPYEDQFPKFRVSGVKLVLTFSYYQRKLAPKPYKRPTGRRSNDVICVMEVTPLYAWTNRAPEISYMINTPSDPVFMHGDEFPEGSPSGEVVRAEMSLIRSGVELIFKTKGEIGQFSFSELIAALVASSVMLNVAQTIVTFAALYALGLSSQLYREFLRESVDWRKEYARYASQALVAGFAFMGYDRDHSGKLDRREIFKVLTTVLGHRMSESTIAALTDFVMRQGESDSEVDKGKFTGINQVDSTISIEEWIDIFTEEKVQMTSLERLIKMEYQDEEDLEALKFLATTNSRKHRDLSYTHVKSLGERLLDEDEAASDESSEIDPDYISYTENKKAFFKEFFLCNAPPQVQQPAPPPEPELDITHTPKRENGANRANGHQSIDVEEDETRSN